ncbi:ABC transporter permease [Neomegalonema sp.]|uniref:ABC transporter permease n=1 Tax=Neomegalonema sp. TaxID=2039713 RepID=UPI0026278BD7|nr:ABC transporter permease [Neomegalonema sp.]MDD2869728.1 ABC transporter permease [Neomegalonema sp.]
MSKVVYWVSLSFAFFFLAAPLLIVLPLAFNDSSFLTYPMEGFTFRWFGVFFDTPPWLSSLANSFKVALGTTLAALLIGGLAAMGVMLLGRWGRIVMSALFVSPLVIPSVVLGVAMAYAFGRAGWGGGYLSLVFAHTILAAPLVFLAVTTSLMGLDPELDRAAASMGASRWRRFHTVTLPLAMPGFATGALFAFITSFDEVVVALFLSTPQTQTLPITLFSSLRDRLEPTIVVVALLLSIVSCLFILALNRLQRRGAGR